MALHRDIYWVGRQWAVTGFGVQAVDQRLKGAFDIEVAHLWDDDLPQRMRALAWLKADDFDKALDIARARFPEPPRKSLPLVESILELIPPAGRSEPPKSPAAPIEASVPASQPPNPPLARNEAAPPGGAPKPSVPSIDQRRMSAPSEPVIEARLPAADLPKVAPAPIETGAPPATPPKPAAAPVTASAPASRPPTRTVIGSKPAPPPAAPPKPVVAPVENNVPPSKLKPLVAAPIEAGVRAAKPGAIEQSPAKFQPVALRIEHASAKFLPRWRVRHRPTAS